MNKRRRVQISFPPEENMTRQEFEKECNINNIMARYQKTGIINHISKFQPMYGDFESLDFQTAMDRIKNAETMFGELPSKARKYFNNDPAEFLAFVQDPDNIDRMVDLGLASYRPEGDESTDPVPTQAPAPENAS